MDALKNEDTVGRPYNDEDSEGREWLTGFVVLGYNALDALALWGSSLRLRYYRL